MPYFFSTHVSVHFKATPMESQISMVSYWKNVLHLIPSFRTLHHFRGRAGSLSACSPHHHLIYVQMICSCALSASDTLRCITKWTNTLDLGWDCSVLLLFSSIHRQESLEKRGDGNAVTACRSFSHQGALLTGLFMGRSTLMPSEK